MFRIDKIPPEVLEKARGLGDDMLKNLNYKFNNQDVCCVGELKAFLSLWPDQYIISGIQGLQMAGNEKQ